jgi:hypothetical protein
MCGFLARESLSCWVMGGKWCALLWLEIDSGLIDCLSRFINWCFESDNYTRNDKRVSFHKLD